MTLLFERPFSPDEQQLIRDHLRATGRTASLIGALWVTAAAGGYVLGTALGYAIAHTHLALQNRRRR